MKLYITGATGFVGSEVVRQAQERGHEVVAVVRPASTTTMPAAVTAARVDLRSRRGLAESLAGVDAVIHLAAAKEGDFHTQFAGTVVATENLLGAMTEARVNNLVAISTFSVYDYQALPPGALVTESSPIDRNPGRRDEYARTKLVQEELYRRFRNPKDGAPDQGGRCVILRPGMIYGANNLWHALLGTGLGSRYLRIGAKATLPMTYVENCAEAMVLAAERLVDGTTAIGRSGAGVVTGDEGRCIDGIVINLVDDDLPTQDQYADAVSERAEVPPSITVPWDAVRLGADALATVNRRLLGDRAKFPGIVVPDRLHARFKPLRYTNERAKSLLGWSPRYSLIEAIDRSVSREADQNSTDQTSAGATGTGQAGTRDGALRS